METETADEQTGMRVTQDYLHHLLSVTDKLCGSYSIRAGADSSLPKKGKGKCTCRVAIRTHATETPGPAFFLRILSPSPLLYLSDPQIWRFPHVRAPTHTLSKSFYPNKKHSPCFTLNPKTPSSIYPTRPRLPTSAMIYLTTNKRVSRRSSHSMERSIP